MLTLSLPPKTGRSLSSARISRLFAGFCRLLALMYSHTLLTTSVRGSGAEPTTAASSFEGCSGFARAGFGFLAALASVIVKLLKYASLPFAGAKGAGPWPVTSERFLNPALPPICQPRSPSVAIRLSSAAPFAYRLRHHLPHRFFGPCSCLCIVREIAHL